MEILHVFSGIKSASTQVKFFTDFYEMLENSTELHTDFSFTFYIETNTRFFDSLESYKNNKNIELFNYVNSKDMVKDILLNERQFDKIIFHQFPGNVVIKSLFFRRKILNKSVWYTWGGDYRQEPFVNIFMFKQFIYENVLKRLFIFNLNIISCWNIYDFKTIKKNYGTNASFKNATYIPTRCSLKGAEKKLDCNKPIKVLLGNNAQMSNNHLYALNKLKKFNNQDIEIYCPLSYGIQDPNYVKKVIDKGRCFFGDKFFPLTEYMAFDEYVDFLKTIDVGVFYQFRQQGGTNMYYLLLFGAKLYLNLTSQTALHYRDIGIKVYETKSVDNSEFEFFHAFENNIRVKNTKIIKHKFSHKSIVNGWKALFYA